MIRPWFVAILGLMWVPLFRRLVVVFSVLAFLLAGFAMTSVAANAPCGMDMAASAAADGAPCDGGSMPDDPEKVPSVSVCFAKCPVPLLDRAAAPLAPAHVESPVQALSLYPVRAGIGILPPLEPPRA